MNWELISSASPVNSMRASRCSSSDTPVGPVQGTAQGQQVRLAYERPGQRDEVGLAALQRALHHDAAAQDSVERRQIDYQRAKSIIY